MVIEIRKFRTGCSFDRPCGRSRTRSASTRGGQFYDRFIELARNVYRNNDRRAVVKRRINQLTGSEIVEEKSYV